MKDSDIYIEKIIAQLSRSDQEEEVIEFLLKDEGDASRLEIIGHVCDPMCLVQLWPLVQSQLWLTSKPSSFGPISFHVMPSQCAFCTEPPSSPLHSRPILLQPYSSWHCWRYDRWHGPTQSPSFNLPGIEKQAKLRWPTSIEPLCCITAPSLRWQWCCWCQWW